MRETAARSSCPVIRLSFAGAIRIVLQSAAAIRVAAPRRRWTLRYAAMDRLAMRPNPYRPGRVEPRLVKRDKNKYAYLRTSRAEVRKRA